MSGPELDMGGATYLSVIGGRFRQTVDPSTPNATKREYKDENDNIQTKHELVFKSFTGRIFDVTFKDGKHGERLLVRMKTDGDDYVISMSSKERYAINFLRRLPGVDFNADVKLVPYDIKEGEKRSAGIKIEQFGETITDYFWDSVKKENKGGIPEMDVRNPSSDDWQLYFMQVKKFLKRMVEEQISPKLKGAVIEPAASAPADEAFAQDHGGFDDDTEDTGDDLPF